MLYEIADHHKTSVEELTGNRRRYSTINLPGSLADELGLDDSERVLTIEHHDEGLSSSEVPFIHALWQLKNEEQEKNNK